MIEYAIPLLMGLLGSTHCLGMCGGIVSAINMQQQKMAYQVIFNLGRISTYALLGLMTGLIGQLVFMKSWWVGLLSLRIIAAILMIAVGFYLIGKTQSLAWIEKMGNRVWRNISPLTKAFLPINSYSRAWGLGLLWGMLPCGLVYSALIISLAQGQFLQNGLFMWLFGLGTLPAIIGLGVASQSMNQALKKKFSLLSGILVLSFGIWTLIAVIIASPDILSGQCNQLTKVYQRALHLFLQR